MTDTNIKRLRDRLSSLESAVIAFSGGVDSAVLTAVAFDALKDRILAVTGSSPSVPSRDMGSAVSFCQGRGIPHMVVETSEFTDNDFVSNPDNRCFYCKSNLFGHLKRIAAEKGFKFVVEGTNASEITGHRPGFGAAQSDKGIATPFVELGLTKDDVRSIARELGLEVAERPSTACLASRIPTGVRIEPEVLKRIDEAENYLLWLGVKQVRVRHHGDIARIEADEAGMRICLENSAGITAMLASLGWKNVTLDLKGYRTGGGM
jgi:uncharacterized protein